MKPAITPLAAYYAEKVGSIVAGPSARPGQKTDPAESFFSMLNKAMNQVNNDKIHAARSAEELSLGRSRDVHSTIIAMERADTEFRLLQQVRNKLLDGYNELFRMSI